MKTSEVKRWTLELETMPGFERAMDRIEAWFAHEIIDRPPVRFHAHNAEYARRLSPDSRRWPDLKTRWFDAEFQVDAFAASVEGRTFRAETFPIYMPNLGPEVYSAFYGCELEYGEVTSWAVPVIRDWDDIARLRLDMRGEYFRKIEELTRLALEKCPGKFMVGYTDLHPGVDCVAAWRDPQALAMDMLMAPERVEELIGVATRDFAAIFAHFDAALKAAGQLSTTWIGVPSFGTLHVPSCDFSTMISAGQWDRFCQPVMEREIKLATHNIFHVDGKGVARHLDRILAQPEIQAIQWVQGAGDDLPIMQWTPLIKRMQAAGKSVIVDLQLSELEAFIGEMNPRGLMLWIPVEDALQEDVLRRIEQW